MYLLTKYSLRLVLPLCFCSTIFKRQITHSQFYQDFLVLPLGKMNSLVEDKLMNWSKNFKLNFFSKIFPIRLFHLHILYWTYTLLYPRLLLCECIQQKHKHYLYGQKLNFVAKLWSMFGAICSIVWQYHFHDR